MLLNTRRGVPNRQVDENADKLERTLYQLESQMLTFIKTIGHPGQEPSKIVLQIERMRQ